MKDGFYRRRLSLEEMVFAAALVIPSDGQGVAPAEVEKLGIVFAGTTVKAGAILARGVRDPWKTVAVLLDSVIDKSNAVVLSGGENIRLFPSEVSGLRPG